MNVEEFLEHYSGIEMTLYISEHAMNKFRSRHDSCDSRLEDLANVNNMQILFQKYRKDLVINDFKALLDLGEVKAIINVYERDGNFYGKMLTVLTEAQLVLSKNFWFYSRIEIPIPISIKEVKKEETFFGFDYKNIFDELDYDKVRCAIVSSGEEVEESEYNNSKRKADLGLGKYFKIKLRDDYIYTK